MPVTGTDGRVHLGYELLFTNVTKAVVRVQAVEVIDADHPSRSVGQNRVVTREGNDVTNLLLPLAIATLGSPTRADYSDRLEPGQSALMFFDVTLRPSEEIPQEIAHRVTLAQAALQNVSSDDPVEPPTSETPITAFSAAIGGRAKVSGTAPLVLRPPLEGHGWFNSNGYGAILNHHRYGTFAVNGTLRVPQRFAIDFVQLDAKGNAVTGDVHVLANWVGFGKPVLSAASGRVVQTVDTYPDNVPLSVPPITLENIGGNYVVVDLGAGRYAFYGHLVRGSVAVREGEFVFYGQRLGLMGNSGNSTAPHLHFQVSDRPFPVDANALPFVFERQVYEGQLGEESIDRTGAGVRFYQMPLTNDVVGFQ
jgi:murein DD-endopeptidase MepM/ murein hydrolase activator NlpD